jgi:hypothetical protein
MDGLPNDKDGRFVDEFVLLSVGFKVDLAPNGVVQVDLTVNHISKGWRRRICIK